MQRTRFDNWLIRNFVNETRVQTLRHPQSVPKGVITEELPETPGKRFRYRFIIRKDKLAEAFVAQLREENLMFSTAVVNRPGHIRKWIAAPGKSLTWRVFSMLLLIYSLTVLTIRAKRFFSDPGVQRVMMETLQDFFPDSFPKEKQQQKPQQKPLERPRPQLPR